MAGRRHLRRERRLPRQSHLDDRRLRVEAYPDHPPGPLRLIDPGDRKIRDLGPVSSAENGWGGVLAPRATTNLYTISRPDGDPLVLLEAHWADWDQRGRLAATVGGRVLTGMLTRKKTLVWRELVASIRSGGPRVWR